MATPDFATSRRQLRRARVQDALQMQRHGVVVERHRDRLLELVARASTNPEPAFDGLAEDEVDTVVSVALCELDESAEDQLAVVLMCLHVLIHDGQFARVTLLADRLHSIGGRFELMRPFLSVAVNCLHMVLVGRQQAALRTLETALGTGKGLPAKKVQRSREQLNDILAAAALRALLREADENNILRSSRDAALRVGDGLLLAFVDVVSAWGMASSTARPEMVLAEADPTFNNPELSDYLGRLGIQTLFPAQLRAIHAGVTLDESHMVSLPTSSGKTLIAEFRIAAALTRNPGTKAIYVAPYRLLARQVEENLRKHFTNVLGFTVRDLGGGYDAASSGQSDADVVICTPERLDSLLRLSSTDKPGAIETAGIFERCSVLVFDELHLIARPGRGPRFEMLLARMRNKYPSIPILGLSAASLGADEVAEWLGSDRPISGARRPTGTLELTWASNGELYQRVSRRAPTRVAELDRGKTALDDAANLILRLSGRHRPVLAVCVSRQNAESLASKLVKGSPEIAATWRDGLTATELHDLNQAIEEIRALMGAEHPLTQHMESGIAFHHAGVPTHALQQIERLASRRILRAVSATTTVAEGADLPFRAVVIPHLNFPGGTGRLERDLYLNIIGRAGRANVSMEGTVFLLGSNAPTLRNYISQSLWTTTAGDRIRGRIPYITPDAVDLDDLNSYLEVQSHVLAWLGDADSYVPRQAEVLARSTLSFDAGNSSERRAVVWLIERALSDLERDGFALAASPYQLTERGEAARLTGLSPASASRVSDAVADGVDSWMQDLSNLKSLDPDLAAQIAKLVFEAGEVFQHSLWFRREVGSSPASRLSAMRQFNFEGARKHEESDTFMSDITLLSRWMMGDSYAELAAQAPVFKSSNSLFGGSNEMKRTSDSAEYIGKLTYPAAWVWSSAMLLAKERGLELPSFIKNSIEYGVQTETAAQLVNRAYLTRAGAAAIARACGEDWEEVKEQISDDALLEDFSSDLTSLDYERLQSLGEQLRLAAQ